MGERSISAEAADAAVIERSLSEPEAFARIFERHFGAVHAYLTRRVGSTRADFAVALGTQLITVPYIDYRVNPYGIPGNNGAIIQGGFTRPSARQLTAELRLGPLPVTLKPISINSAPVR